MRRASPILARRAVPLANRLRHPSHCPAADGVHLKGLLLRRTLHGTFPNIIIGGRSIGGADDLERMQQDGTLAKLLEEATAV